MIVMVMVMVGIITLQDSPSNRSPPQTTQKKKSQRRAFFTFQRYKPSHKMYSQPQEVGPMKYGGPDSHLKKRSCAGKCSEVMVMMMMVMMMMVVMVMMMMMTTTMMITMELYHR